MKQTTALIDFNVLDLEKIKTFLFSNIESIKLIIIFGSFAKNQANKNSDLDIAFLTDLELSDVKRWTITQELASQINIDIDLVDLNKASDVFKFQIISSGKVIYQLGDMDRYLDQVYLTYLKLNEDRQEIIENYGK